MRSLLAAIVLGLVLSSTVIGDTAEDPALQSELRQLFPDAVSFSQKVGNPPHYEALGAPGDDGKPRLLGLAYWTTELEPLERGYDGPIKILVGMNMSGVLTGIIVTENREPYGYFSVDTPAFAKQFANKSIRDPFRVGADIDAISRATISVTSASRAVRNSSRRMARAYLKPPGQ